MKKLHFFIPMKKPPTVTAQQKKFNTKTKQMYDSDDLKKARALLTALVAPYKPEKPFSKATRLITKWFYPATKHKDGEWKITKPDTDNSIKLLKDCMASVGFFTNDAIVCSEITEKFYGKITGIYVEIIDLTKE